MAGGFTIEFQIREESIDNLFEAYPLPLHFNDSLHHTWIDLIIVLKDLKNVHCSMR